MSSTASGEKKVEWSLSWLQRKLWVIWQIASNDVTQWLGCIVGHVKAPGLKKEEVYME